MSDQADGKRGRVEWWALTVDCPDPGVMAEFYVALLGGHVTRQTADETNVDAGGMPLNFRSVADFRPPTWPTSEVPLHSHFDYVVEDPEALAEELLGLGGTLAAHQDQANRNLVVVLDPAGHPFCLLRSSAARRF